MNRPFQCALVVTALLASSSAWAQDFGKKGQFAVSAERLFGITHTSARLSLPGGDQTNTVTGISLLSAPLATSANNAFWGGYGSPRVAGDYFVIDHLSLGAALGYSHASVTRPQGNAEVTVSGDSVTFAPRVGYAIAFTDLIGIWPRGGLSYRNFSAENSSTHDLAFTLEAPFTFNVVPHVVFWAGPTLDLGLSGSSKVEVGNGSVSTDFNATEIGLQTGLVAYFGG